MKLTALFLTFSQDNKTLNNQLQRVNTRLHSVEGEKEHFKQRVAQLEREIKELKKAQNVVVHTGQPVVPVEFTMMHFQQHKQDDYEWYSLPFYTHFQNVYDC